MSIIGCTIEPVMVSPRYQRGFIPLVYFLYGGVLLLVSTIGIFGYKEYQLKQKVLGVTTSPLPTLTIPSQSPTTTPTAKPIVKTANPDPVITCLINSNCGGGSKEMRRSDCEQTTCCQIGNKWYFYLSKTKCIADQNSYNSNNNVGTYNVPTYTPPTYYSCTLYYPALHTYSTYDHLYKTKEECDTAQANLNYTTSTPIPQPTIDVGAYNAQVSRCRQSVVEKYSSLLQSCNQYGSSSAYDACTYAYEQERKKEYDACGTTI